MSRYDYLIAGLITFVALYFKLRQLLRDPRSPALRAICGTLAGLGISVIVGWESLYLAIDRTAGIPNLARYLEHGFCLIAAASIQSLFLFLGDPDKAPRRVKIRWLTLAAALAVMGFVFARGGFDQEATNDFATRYATHPQFSQYMLVFLAYLAMTMIDILRMSARYGRQLQPSLLRLGIRLLIAGSIVGLVYVLHKTAFIFCAMTHLAFPWNEGPASQAMVLIGIALVAGGLVIPAAGTYVLDIWHWPHRYRLYRDLYPLWDAIRLVVRDVGLHPPSRRPGIRLMNIALYRRVIEIRDGLRELHVYLDPSTIADGMRQAADQRVPDRDSRAIGEAAGIAEMLDYLASTTVTARKPANTKGRNSDLEDAGDNIAADAEWLAAVAQAYAHSPIVADLRRTRRAAKT